MFVLLRENTLPLDPRWHQACGRSWEPDLSSCSLKKPFQECHYHTGGAEVPSWVHGEMCKEGSFSFLPLFPPFHLQLKPQQGGRSHTDQVLQAGASARSAGAWGVGPQLLPVLLGQVGLHVKEDILPLLDVGAQLLNELCLLPTGVALVPVVRGVGVKRSRGVTQTAGRIWKLWVPPSHLAIAMLLTTSVLHLYSLRLMLTPC